MDYIDSNLKFYKEKFSANGNNDPKSLGWGHGSSQEIRFEQFLRIFDLENKSILDVGCGFGHFYDFLKKKKINPSSYTGLDLIQHNIKCASEAHPDAKFIEGDFLKLDNLDQYDVVVSSGLLGLNYDNWQTVTENLISKMFLLCKQGMVYNMESLWKYQNNEEIMSRLGNRNYDPAFWIDFSRKISKNMCFLHDYPKADFTIALYKEND